MELSEQAQAICAEHYNWRSRSSCNKCPLQPECHKPCAQLTQESLDSWRKRVNDLADRHSTPLPYGVTECAKAQLDIFNDTKEPAA